MLIKICGLTTVDDARRALEAGADYLGFVLYPKSPRCVTVDELSRIVEGLPVTAKKVGVFVNEPPDRVSEIVERCGLSAAQLHGDENPAGFGDLGVSVWRAIRLRDGRWSPDPDLWIPERYVMDADSPAYGGAGMRVDWDAAKAFVEEHHCMLAGGLTPVNVGEAIRRVRPAGVDVSSGVELSPGKKDHRKVEIFIRAVRDAEKK